MIETNTNNIDNDHLTWAYRLVWWCFCVDYHSKWNHHLSASFSSFRIFFALVGGKTEISFYLLDFDRRISEFPCRAEHGGGKRIIDTWYLIRLSGLRLEYFRILADRKRPKLKASNVSRKQIQFIWNMIKVESCMNDNTYKYFHGDNVQQGLALFGAMAALET